MAEAMQGAAAPLQSPEQMTPENLAAFERMRQEMPVSEFNSEVLSSAAEADPMAVAEFKSELRDLNLPPALLDSLNQVVDAILEAPENYAALRQQFLSDGIPEDFLPPTFDPEFFGALNLAVDEIRETSGNPRMAPQNFAKGGIASLRPIAAAIAEQGRGGDTMLAHITPSEAQLLKSRGGAGTINPVTGLPEFGFLSKAWKKVKGAVKKVGKAVKKFAKSKVGRIVTTLALAFVLGPAAAATLGVSSTVGVAAVSGFVGSAGSTLVAGGNLKDALKAGAIGGLVGGAGAGVFGGAEAFKAGSYTGPTTIGGQLAKAKESVFGAPQPAPVSESVNLLESAAQTTPIGDPFAANATGTGVVGSTPSTGFTPLTGAEVDAMNLGLKSSGSVPYTGAEIEAMNLGIGSIPTNAAANVAKTAATETPGLMRSVYDTLVPNDVGIGEGLRNIATNLSPAARKAAGAEGFIGQYGPLLATGAGIMAATGGFDQQPATVPAGFEEMAAGQSGGARLLSEQPEKYGLDFGGVRTSYAYDPYQYMYAPPPPPPTYANPMTAADGGSAEYPRKNGHISGPGTGTSDDIPAMLSDGEFVFTAKSVRNMGDGSRRKGAKRMYALMKKLEGGRSNG
tara:strand:+ start:2833 stop:4701 length:1869 start_codon:yes stop_codon:yes gene_type:complete